MNSNKNHLLIEGFGFLALGLIALLISLLFTDHLESLIGWIFVIAGLIQCFRLLNVSRLGFGASLVSLFLYFLVGFLLIFSPLKGMMTLVALLAFFYFLEGFAQIIFGILVKNLKKWEWFVACGVLSVATSFIIYNFKMTLEILGLLVGINLLFYGFARVVVAKAQRS